MKKLFTCALCLLTAVGMNAADFFSTEKSDKLLTFGARVGVNTYNRTIDDGTFTNGYHTESWRTGFDVGGVINLNFRDYLAIQPGIFFDIYNSGLTVMGHEFDSATSVQVPYGQTSRLRCYNLTIPVMAVVGFNLTDDLRWTVEAGPYLSIVLGSKMTDKYLITIPDVYPDRVFGQKPAPVDFGVKVGTGIRLFQHYYIGAHYLAGCLDAWKEKQVGQISKNFGGLTKTWTFTIGYDF